MFTKKNPFDVFLRSQYINGYYILNVCENINVCVHNFMDDFDSLELKQENEINENNIVIQVS